MNKILTSLIFSLGVCIICPQGLIASTQQSLYEDVKNEYSNFKSCHRYAEQSLPDSQNGDRTKDNSNPSKNGNTSTNTCLIVPCDRPIGLIIPVPVNEIHMYPKKFANNFDLRSSSLKSRNWHFKELGKIRGIGKEPLNPYAKFIPYPSFF